MPKRQRLIGTTSEVVRQAEIRLGRSLPPTFKAWVLLHNGSHDIFPIPDAGNPRTLIGDIFHERDQLAEWGTAVGLLVPIAAVGDGDLWCLDLARLGEDGEAPVVRWFHETGECQDEASTFAGFIRKRDAGEIPD